MRAQQTALKHVLTWAWLWLLLFFFSINSKLLLQSKASPIGALCNTRIASNHKKLLAGQSFDIGLSRWQMTMIWTELRGIITNLSVSFRVWAWPSPIGRHKIGLNLQLDHKLTIVVDSQLSQRDGKWAIEIEQPMLKSSSSGSSSNEMLDWSFENGCQFCCHLELLHNLKLFPLLFTHLNLPFT